MSSTHYAIVETNCCLFKKYPLTPSPQCIANGESRSIDCREIGKHIVESEAETVAQHKCSVCVAKRNVFRRVLRIYYVWSCTNGMRGGR